MPTQQQTPNVVQLADGDFKHELANTRKVRARVPTEHLTIYLRLLNMPIPGMYGPSADEQ